MEVYNQKTSINNRPLTFIYDDEGLSYALTPSHLIYGRQISSHLNHRYYEILSTTTTLTKRAKHQQRMLDQFSKQLEKGIFTQSSRVGKIICETVKGHNQD